MNERIKELMAQAGIYQPERFDGVDGSNQFEKFAELIVRECANMIVAEAESALGEYMSEEDTGYVGGLHNAATLIKEHFGVEE